MQPARPTTTRGAMTLTRFRGIPIRVHWTLLLALPFFAWLMATAYFAGSPLAWFWGATLAITLFASVTVHELAHSLVAMRLGTSIREILLLPIGGASVMSTPPREPRVEFLVAAVGPLTSLLLGGLLVGGAVVADVPLTSPAAVPAPQGYLLASGYLNLALGLFNLLVPAFPMDGGRMVRAALARSLGLEKATRLAASIGRGSAVVMGIGGLLIGNLILVIIAVFVWASATAEEQAVRVSSALDGVHLGDVMTSSPATVAPDATLDEALHIMLATKHVTLPVVAEDRPVGIVRSDDLAAVPPAERHVRRVADLPARDVPRAAPTEPASSALPTVVEAGLVAIVDAAGRLVGIVTPTDISRTVQLLAARDRGRPS